MENLTGTVERIVYQNDENHWTVARLKLAETTTANFFKLFSKAQEPEA